MKTTIQNLHHLTGEPAYLIYWRMVYDCKPKLSTVMAIDQNLEIIVNDEGDLLALKYDYPDNMKGMVIGEGQWCYPNQKIILESEVRKTLKGFINLMDIINTSKN
jgi:hypothetical protein